MRIVITGGTGFIGSHFVAKGLELGWDIHCLVRKDISPAISGIRLLSGDLAAPESLPTALEKAGAFDVLVHLGAALPVPLTPIQTYLTINTTSTGVLLDLARKAGARKFVYCSSLPVIGVPSSIPITERHPVVPETNYHLSKWFGEKLCEQEFRRHGLSTTSLRLSAPYGIGMNSSSVIPFFMSRAINSEPITLHGTGAREQTFIHVKDVVQGLVLAATSDTSGTFNLAGSETISMLELAKLVIASVPGCTSAIGFSGRKDPQESYRWQVDISKIRNIGYSPNVSLKRGLSRLADKWAECNGHMSGQWWQK